ncbi:MAG: hypothetical protein PHE67_00900 [Campylobacterales bacterium]|nr:hypothetical protein [Campylobacterales bacterium]
MSNIYETLYKKYNKTTLTKKETAQELGINVSRLNRLLQENRKEELPEFIRFGNSGKAHYLFKLESVAQMVTASRVY